MTRGRPGVEYKTFELKKLTLDIEKAAAYTAPRLLLAVRRSAEELRDDWRKNARSTARRHGKYYPPAVGFDLEDRGLRAVIGPDINHPRGQGGMAFEYGSRNQPPHLDGNRAADVVGPKFVKRVNDAAGLDL